MKDNSQVDVYVLEDPGVNCPPIAGTASVLIYAGRMTDLLTAPRDNKQRHSPHPMSS